DLEFENAPVLRNEAGQLTVVPIRVCEEAQSGEKLRQSIFGKITNNNGESAFSEFIWSEEILNQPEILKLAAPGRDGSVQFGICAIHNGTLELADNLLGHAVFSDEPRREADSISQSQLIRNRVTDLEVIYIQ